MVKLLSEKLLTREHEIKFELMEETNESVDPEYYDDLYDAAEVRKIFNATSSSFVCFFHNVQNSPTYRISKF